MFRKRLLSFSVVLAVVALVVFGRLAQIQVLHAQEFEALADRLLTPSVQYSAAPRGSVFDRNGVPLLRDEPTSDLSIHYGVIAGRDDYILTLASQMRRRGDMPAGMTLREISDELRARIDRMWRRLSQLTGMPIGEFKSRALAIRERVERLKEYISERTPTVRRIAEEEREHAILEDIDPNLALTLRLELEDAPWLRVEPGSRRVARDADPVAHLIGRLGQASPERIADDPLRDDELRRLRPGDRCGISGIERMADEALRGTRGKIIFDVEGQEVERTPPRPGRDVHLTIDIELQKQVLEILERAVAGSLAPAGASAVVLDVRTREVLALVSYPTFEFARFDADYDKLRHDTIRMPLLFRAVQGQYPPGSICKAITLIGGLTEGRVTPETSFGCNGYLLDNQPERFRCWIYNQEPRGTHGPQTAEEAVKHSCNIYFFHVGERVGPEGICQWFRRFGLGRGQGIGLIEESAGIVPDEAWLRRNFNRGHEPADAWNFAIGQGEVTATPLQAAAVAATIASGFWAPVKLAYDSSGALLSDMQPDDPPLDERWLQVVRRGMWRVVNERGGTAVAARLGRTDHEMCGKTGSAQTVPRVVNTRYILEWPSGRREEVVAYSADEALEGFAGEKPKIVGYRANERYPEMLEGEKLPSHAWFIGFTQPRETPRGGRPRGRSYAISVLIEFGGGGGRVAGPVAKEIAELLLDRPE